MAHLNEWLLNRGGLYSRFDRTRQSFPHEQYFYSTEHGTKVILLKSFFVVFVLFCLFVVFSLTLIM